MSVIGQFFGEYQVIRELGHGVVATVYLASDGERLKALKLFAPEHRSRAERELRLGRGLEHPNLNRIEAWQELAGRPGLLMPYVPGVRLTDLAGEERGHEAVLGACSGILQALAHMHSLGMVHRDVKPENIIVGRDGHAVLIDYDLATELPSKDDTIAAAGTPAFLSPEQARHEPATEASDLYAVGIILFWGLTGRVPFTGTVEQVTWAHAIKRPDVANQLPPALHRFVPPIEKLLAKRPGLRYRSALEVLQVLEAIRAGS